MHTTSKLKNKALSFHLRKVRKRVGVDFLGFDFKSIQCRYIYIAIAGSSDKLSHFLLYIFSWDADVHGCSKDFFYHMAFATEFNRFIDTCFWLIWCRDSIKFRPSNAYGVQLKQYIWSMVYLGLPLISAIPVTLLTPYDLASCLFLCLSDLYLALD